MTPTINDIDAEVYLSTITPLENELIVMGHGPGYLEELDIVAALFPKADLMAINIAGHTCKYPVKYISTLHAFEYGNDTIENIPGLRSWAIPKEAIVYGSETYGAKSKRIDRVLKIDPAGGTSSLFGVVVGLTLGYQKIITVGVHLKPGTIYFDKHVFKNWRNVWGPIFKDKVRGFSGLPKTLFGGID